MPVIALAALLLILAPVQGWANNNNNNSSTTSTMNSDNLSTEDNPFSGFASADYYGGFRTDSDPSAAYYVLGSYKIKTGSLQVYQVLSHRLIKDKDEAEILASDTSFRFLAKSSPFIDNWKWQYRVEATAPVSQFSQDQDVYSKPSLQLRFNTTALKKKLSVSVRPMYREYINRFKTTVSEPGAGGGRPLRKSLFGVTLLAGLSLTDRTSLDLIAAYNRIRYENVRFTNANSDYNYSEFAQHQYLVDFAGNYDLIPSKWSVSAGYSIDSIVERLGGIEYLAFDDQLSTWYVRTTVLF